MRLLRQFDAPDILLYFTFSVFSIIYCRQDQTPSTFRESGLWANKNWIEILSFKLDYLTSWLAHTTILGWRVVTSPDSRSPFCRLFYLGTRSVASKGSPSSWGLAVVSAVLAASFALGVANVVHLMRTAF